MRMKARLLLAACCLFVAAGSAAADNGLHQPPLSNAVAEVSPSAVAGGSTAAIVFTFTLGSVPAGITNGELELDAPAGWTFTGVVSNGATTCDVTGATTSFDAAKVVVSGFVCGGGDTLLLDLSVDTPTVSADSAYGFDVSFKTRPGGRRRYNNVWRTGQLPITVTATPFLASPSTPSNFVQRVGKTLVLGGNPYTFTGLNAYYANGRGRCGPSVDLGASLDAWGAGNEVVRAWFFQDLATTEGAHDWSAFDQTLATAKAHGYRVIATLANQ